MQFSLTSLPSLPLGSFLVVIFVQVTSSRLCNPRSRSFKPLLRNGLPSCSLSVRDFPSGRPIAGRPIVPSHRNTSTPFPPWMNLTLARQGQAFAQKNLFFVVLNAFPGVISGLPVPDEAGVLAFTGHVADRDSAIDRYLATGAQLQVWIKALLSSKANDNAILTSIGHVRNLHMKAAHKANAAGKPYVPQTVYDNVTTDDVMWAAIAADLDLKIRRWPPEYSQFDGSTTAVNQYIQGLTLLQFMGHTIMDPKSVYIWDATNDELKAYMHLWAVIGWVLGIDDEYNICLQPDPRTAAVYLRSLFEHYVYPAWFQIDKIGKVLVEAALDHNNRYLPGLGPRVLMTMILRDYFRIDVRNMLETLSLADLLLLRRFDTQFVPSTRRPAVRRRLNAAFDTAINLGVRGLYGPYKTYMDKAQYVYYNKPRRTG